jgi:hypothetical protein
VKNVRAIIDAFGGLETLKDNPITLAVPGYMPLSIEHLGTGPRGGVLISVMHTLKQNGDLMRDPDVVVEVIPPAGWWLPVRYRQDALGIYQEAVVLDGDRLVTRSRLVDSLKQFLVEWDPQPGQAGLCRGGPEAGGQVRPWGKGLSQLAFHVVPRAAASFSTTRMDGICLPRSSRPT